MIDKNHSSDGKKSIVEPGRGRCTLKSYKEKKGRDKQDMK
jgi:hypothetical protein